MRTGTKQYAADIAQDSSVTGALHCGGYENVKVGIPILTGLDNTSAKLRVEVNCGTVALPVWRNLYTQAATQVAYATTVGGLVWDIPVATVDQMRVAADTTATAAAGVTLQIFGQR